MRKPYWERGRRVYFGRCGICGVFYRKNYRHETKQMVIDNQRRTVRYEICFVECDYHGETMIDKKFDRVID